MPLTSLIARHTYRPAPAVLAQLETSSDIPSPADRSEPLVYWILRRLAKGPVSDLEVLSQLEQANRCSTAEGAKHASLLLERLARQGYVESKAASAIEDHRASLRLTKKASRYLEDLALYPQTSQRLSGLGRVSLRSFRLTAPFNRPVGPAGPVRRGLGVAKEILEARTSTLSPLEKQRILRDYVASVEGQLDWTNQLLREKKPISFSNRGRMR